MFLSTLSLRRATCFAVFSITQKVISIHALLAESDQLTSIFPTKKQHFYPRSPCGERPQDAAPIYQGLQFLSTLSLRRATGAVPCGVSPALISIHALLAESDHRPAKSGLGRPIFLSTLSLRRATNSRHNFGPENRKISIHALLAESDNALAYM